MSSSDVCNPDRFIISGKRWIRTTEGVRQQIYSLPHLATLVSSQFLLLQLDLPRLQVREPMEGFEPTTPRLQITCSGQLSYIGISTVTGCKGRDIFYICKFFEHFFSNASTFLLSSPTFARSKNGDYPIRISKSENRVQI